MIYLYKNKIIIEKVHSGAIEQWFEWFERVE